MIVRTLLLCRGRGKEGKQTGRRESCLWMYGGVERGTQLQAVQRRGGMLNLSSILHQNNRPNTSNLWLLTFFPFLFHTILGRGSPVAWHMKEATPPCTPVWSLGVLRNFGGAEERERERETKKQQS